MTDEERFPKLSGTQEVLFSENGDCVARVSALALSHLQGSHFKVEHAQAVSRIGLGMALCSFGLSVLYAADAITEDEIRDIDNLIREVAEGNQPAEDQTFPF